MPRRNNTPEEIGRARDNYIRGQREKAEAERQRISALSGKADAGELLTVDELAHVCRETIKAKQFPGQPVTASARHRGAAARHGWLLHAHHEGAKMRLSIQDYKAALAAAETSDERGRARCHEPAMSPHHPSMRRGV